MKALAEQIADLDGVEIYGRVVGVRGLMVEMAGPIHAMSVGARLTIETGSGSRDPLRGGGIFRRPRAGHAVRRARRGAARLPRGGRHRGRHRTAVRALARPRDQRHGRADRRARAAAAGPAPYPFRSSPPPAHARMRVGAPLDLGVRALNTFLTVCRGQRMGIFSGSGVGKSVLLSMLARNVAADISVIGLVGERGREVQEFLQDDLGPAGLARSVVVVSTSDEPALMRRQAAYLTLAIAEYLPRPRTRTCWC